ncbi:hypothetical protein DSM112329_04800 [Paraconexibacter sp. AEG42_29]|uniref:Uncharacterized protein n=1 Tax=Paraconexibacter sp. AEG42_29 TaxID=2997339 RepID=A0AAU7B212_9ACTN
MRDFARRLNGAAKTTLIVGVIGFFIHMTFRSSSSTNGVETSCSYFDAGQFLVALIGVIAAGAALSARSNVHESRRGALKAAALLGFALAAAHAAWGITGAVGITGPCS